MHAEQRLKDLGIDLTPVDHKGHGVLPIRRYENLLYISGCGPFDENGKALMTGRVGVDLTDEDAYEAARLCAVNMLRILKDYLGDLDRVEEFVKVLCLINSGGDFWAMPKVSNGFSDVIVAAFGPRGRHARAAMGVGNHIYNVPAVMDAIVRIRD